LPKASDDLKVERLEDDADSALRINYASTTANAAIMAHNPEATGVANLLTGDTDQYYMSPCSAPKKWVVIGLAEDVRPVVEDCCAVLRCAGGANRRG
jgi:hypothetical protein